MTGADSNTDTDFVRLKQSIKEMIVEELSLLDVSPEEIGDDDQIFGDKFGLDSIDAVELVFQVKTRFGVAIRNMGEGREVLQTVERLAEFIREKAKA